MESIEIKPCFVHARRSTGAARGYLQVEQGNASAIALYASEGFQPAYLYRYWDRAP